MTRLSICLQNILSKRQNLVAWDRSSLNAGIWDLSQF